MASKKVDETNFGEKSLIKKIVEQKICEKKIVLSGLVWPGLVWRLISLNGNQNCTISSKVNMILSVSGNALEIGIIRDSVGHESVSC